MLTHLSGSSWSDVGLTETYCVPLVLANAHWLLADDAVSQANRTQWFARRRGLSGVHIDDFTMAPDPHCENGDASQSVERKRPAWADLFG